MCKSLSLRIEYVKRSVSKRFAEVFNADLKLKGDLFDRKYGKNMNLVTLWNVMTKGVGRENVKDLSEKVEDYEDDAGVNEVNGVNTAGVNTDGAVAGDAFGKTTDEAFGTSAGTSTPNPKPPAKRLLNADQKAYKAQQINLRNKKLREQRDNKSNDMWLEAGSPIDQILQVFLENFQEGIMARLVRVFESSIQ